MADSSWDLYAMRTSYISVQWTALCMESRGLAWQEQGLWGLRMGAETVPLNVACWGTHFPPSGRSGI